MGRRSFHYKFLHSAAHICWYQRAPGSDFWNTTDLSSSSAVDHLLEFLGMKVVVPGGPNEGSASGDRYNMRHLHVNYMTAWPWPDPLTGEHPHRAEQGSATQIVEIKYSLYTIFEHWKTLRLPSFYSCRNYIHFHIFEKKMEQSRGWMDICLVSQQPESQSILIFFTCYITWAHVQTDHLIGQHEWPSVETENSCCPPWKVRLKKPLVQDKQALQLCCMELFSRLLQKSDTWRRIQRVLHFSVRLPERATPWWWHCHGNHHLYMWLAGWGADLPQQEEHRDKKIKFKKKKKKRVKMLPVKVLTRKILIGSNTWWWVSQIWRQRGINENSTDAPVCYQPHLLHRWSAVEDRRLGENTTRTPEWLQPPAASMFTTRSWKVQAD